MNKVISVHQHSCKTHCEHSKICYFVNGKHEVEDNNIDNVIGDIVLNKDDSTNVHFSACNYKDALDIYNKYCRAKKNIYMTLSSNIYTQLINSIEKEELQHFNNHIQLTVYNDEQLLQKEYDNIQKMFLIKDDKTYNIALQIITHKKYKNIHIPISQSYFAKKIPDFLYLISAWNKRDSNVRNITLDSCLTHYLYNGECQYSKNYIDLRFDGTVRRCPFSDEHHKINTDNPDSMFDIEFKPNCIFAQVFKKK
jgi:hypothetical protein